MCICLTWSIIAYMSLIFIILITCHVSTSTLVNVNTCFYERTWTTCIGGGGASAPSRHRSCSHMAVWKSLASKLWTCSLVCIRSTQKSQQRKLTIKGHFGERQRLAHTTTQIWTCSCVGCVVMKRKKAGPVQVRSRHWRLA